MKILIQNRYWLLAIWFVFVLSRILLIHPKLFSSELYPKPEDEGARIWRPVSFCSAKSSDVKPQTFIMYRGTGERRADFHVSRPVKRLHPVWSSNKINLGIHGASKSSPITDGERVFVGGDDSWFRAFSISSGEPQWSFYLGAANRGIHSTAALDESGVYVGSYRGALYKMDRTTGNLIWERIIGDTIGASPWLGEDGIVAAVETTRPDGYLMKLSRENGDIIWRSPAFGEQAHSSPAFDPASRLFILGVNNSTLQAFHAESGERAWSVAAKGQIKSTALLRNGKGYITSWGKDLVSFDVRSGKTLWSVGLADKSQVSPVFLESRDLVVAADRTGLLQAFDAQTGEARWKLSFRSTNPDRVNLQTSPVVLRADNREEQILFMCEDGMLCLISSSGHVLNRVPMHGTLSGVPWLEGNRVFVSLNESGLEAFDLDF
jgi:outer membrane protein assembly factor BamB